MTDELSDSGQPAADRPSTVYVFVSSTFRDMHAERDHLSQVVFPRLQVNPSMLAFAEAKRIQQFEKRHEDQQEIDTNNIHLLSIGTGRAQFSLSPPGPDAGLLYWASRVADVMGTAQVQGMHLPLKFLLGGQYRHINFKMTEPWRLDAVEHIPDLFRVGEKRARECYEWVNESFFQHKRTRFEPVTTTEDEILLDDEFGFE